MSMSNDHLAALIRGLESTLSDYGRRLQTAEQLHKTLMERSKTITNDAHTSSNAAEAKGMAMDLALRLRTLEDAFKRQQEATAERGINDGPRLKAHFDKQLADCQAAIDDLQGKFDAVSEDLTTLNDIVDNSVELNTPQVSQKDISLVVTEVRACQELLGDAYEALSEYEPPSGKAQRAIHYGLLAKLSQYRHD